MIQQRREIQKEVKRQYLFMISNSKALRTRHLAMCDNGESHFYLKKGSFEKECHPSRCGNKNARGRNDVFQLWDNLTVIIFEEDCEKVLKLWVLLRTLKVLQVRA